jgi:hypothetical protein
LRPNNKVGRPSALTPEQAAHCVEFRRKTSLSLDACLKALRTELDLPHLSKTTLHRLFCREDVNGRVMECALPSPLPDFDTEAELRTHGIRSSSMRHRVLGTVLSQDGQFSTRQVYGAIRRDWPTTQKTVRRTLEKFVEIGILTAAGAGTQKRYRRARAVD